MSEIEYRTLDEYPGYRFGSDGSVWSCWTSGPKPKMGEAWRQLKGNAQRYGHLSVMLAGKRYRFIHRLILEAFVGPAPDGLVCRHLNGKAGDNRPENLAWGLPIENSADRVAHGTLELGSRVRHAKMTEEIAREVVERATNGEDLGILALEFGVTKAAVRAVVNGLSWNHATGIPRPEAFYAYRETRRRADKVVRVQRRQEAISK